MVIVIFLFGILIQYITAFLNGFTIPVALISLFFEKNRTRAAAAIFVFLCIRFYYFQRGGMGPTEIEYTLAQLTSGSIWGLLPVMGYGFLVYWWIVLFKKQKRMFLHPIDTAKELKKTLQYPNTGKRVLLFLTVLAAVLMGAYLIAGQFIYFPKKNDIVYDGIRVKNLELLDQFIEGASEQKENKIRIVKDLNPSSTQSDEPKGTVIYDLKSVYDEQTKKGWIAVHPNLKYISRAEREKAFIISSPQHCTSIKKDEEIGYYTLAGCQEPQNYDLFTTDVLGTELQ